MTVLRLGLCLFLAVINLTWQRQLHSDGLGRDCKRLVDGWNDFLGVLQTLQKGEEKERKLSKNYYSNGRTKPKPNN